MKSAVFFFIAMAFAVGMSLPINATDDQTEEDLQFINETQLDLENDNETEASGIFIAENNNSSSSTSEKITVRSMYEEHSGSGTKEQAGSGVKDPGSGITEIGSGIEVTGSGEITVEDEMGEADEDGSAEQKKLETGGTK